MTRWLALDEVSRPQLFEYGVVLCDNTLPDASLVMKVEVPVRVTPTSRDAWLLNFGRNRLSPTLSKLDRKSTRLNSSHSQISYAVFCLKKKKTRTQTMTSSTLLQLYRTTHS